MKAYSVLATTFYVLSYKIAIQHFALEISQVFEVLFLVHLSYFVLSVVAISVVRGQSLFSYKQEAKNAIKIAQFIGCYVLVDALCMKYMTLATYCVIKFCLTSTFKYSRDPFTDQWVYTTLGIPHRMWRILLTIFLIPSVFVNDIVY